MACVWRTAGELSFTLGQETVKVLQPAAPAPAPADPAVSCRCYPLLDLDDAGAFVWQTTVSPQVMALAGVCLYVGMHCPPLAVVTRWSRKEKL